jgi:hypothetical protein
VRLHIRLNPSKEEDRLITRWLARYHRGARRQGIIKACLAAGARAFFEEAAARQAATPAASSAISPAPVVIPSFTSLGQLVQNQPSPALSRGTADIDRTPRQS